MKLQRPALLRSIFRGLQVPVSRVMFALRLTLPVRTRMLRASQLFTALRPASVSCSLIWRFPAFLKRTVFCLVSLKYLGWSKVLD
jgi:hypothetical protein